MNEESVNGKIILGIVPHPASSEGEFGGTIAKWVEEGARFISVIVTNGEKGTNDPTITPNCLSEIRQKEQMAAAKILGISEVKFLNYLDGETYDISRLQKDLVGVIRFYRPDIVITHDPTARFTKDNRINHPDNINVGNAVLDSVYPKVRNRLFYPEYENEGLFPHKVLTVYLSRTNQPNVWVDTSSTNAKRIEALKEHKSQYPNLEEMAVRMTERVHKQAENTQFKYAESFYRVSTRS